MERGDRAPVATFYAPELPRAGGAVALGDAAAHHAGVRRLAPGDVVRLTDGAGRIATGTITMLRGPELVTEMDAAVAVAAGPLLELLVPVADRDRMLWLAEKCAELGVSVWQPVLFARSRSVTPRGEGESFGAKVRARMVAAIEQSAGAWLPEIRRELPLDAALARVIAPHRLLLDRAGARLDVATVSAGTAVTFGPEGGLDARERALLRESAWRAVTLGPTTLRFETAGIAAVAILRAAAHTDYAEE